MNNYPKDIIDGVEVPPLVIRENYDLLGKHDGSIFIEHGTLRLIDHHNGSLHAQPNTKIEILGIQNGSTHIENGATVCVKGSANGSMHLERGGELIICEGGKHSGSLHNSGKVVIRGTHGGSIHDDGDIIVEAGGRIIKSTIRNGVSYYEW